MTGRSEMTVTGNDRKVSWSIWDAQADKRELRHTCSGGPSLGAATQGYFVPAMPMWSGQRACRGPAEIR